MGASTLQVRQPNGATLTFTNSRRALVLRAHELVEAGIGDAEFKLDGEVLEIGSARTPDPPIRDDEPVEAIDAEYLEADSEEKHDTTVTPRAPAMGTQEAAATAQELLANATRLHNELLDSASRRAAEMAALEHTQVQRQLASAKKLQDFVGGMTATLAQERLAAFEIKSHEAQLAEQAAAKEYAKQLAIAEANKPSPAMIFAELAVSFAANLARNSAANFNEMNNPKD